MPLPFVAGTHCNGVPRTDYMSPQSLPTPAMLGAELAMQLLDRRDAAQLPDRSSTSLGSAASFNASAILASKQQYQIQVVAATFSSVTILSAACALYWFCMMRRNFRRDLILLLIVGDVWKSLWFLVFSSVTLSQGKIATHSAFCQGIGYLLQTGVESCDVAIFLMGLHMLLQIFPPKNSYLGSDGLYQARRWVWAAWFILPNISASLAFINDQAGYISQGGFCSLPIRPFWYRLALSWIPRYLNWLFVMGVAIRIYWHVGYEFKVFAQERDQTSSVGNTINPITAIDMDRTASTHSDGAMVEKQDIHGNDQIAPEDDIAIPPIALPPSDPTQTESQGFLRRQSAPNRSTMAAEDAAIKPDGSPAAARISRSTPSSRRGSQQFTNDKAAENQILSPPQLAEFQTRVSFIPAHPGLASFSTDPLSPSLDPITEHKTYHPPSSRHRANAAVRAMQERRRAIQRQLRVLFIYPVVYLIFWIVPFVAHCFNYSNYYAQHPVFTLSVLNVFFQISMGFADVCVFSWRERPWRHIPGSDGTFLGSFMFWRFANDSRYRRESRAMNLFNNTAATAGTSDATAAAATPNATPASPHPSLLKSIKHLSLNVSRHSDSGTGSQSIMQRSPNGSTFAGGNSSELHSPTSPATPRRPMLSPGHRRAYSGGVSDRRAREAELARERLALERADWAALQQQNRDRRSLQDQLALYPGYNQDASSPQTRQPSAISTLEAEKKEPERKEWWDRQMSLDEDLRDDDEVE